MDFMKYNIDFEIFGSIIMIVIILFFKMKFDRQTESEKAFMKLVYFVLIAQIMDMASAVTISIGGPKMALFNLIFTTTYFIVEFYSGISFIRYVLVAAYRRPVRKYKILLDVLAGLFALSVLANMFFGYYFTFDPVTGDYIHEKFYYLLYLIPGLFTINSMILVIYHRRKFDIKQWISVASFVVFVSAGLILQGLVFPHVYLAFGLVTIAILMIVFSLETPDYRKLIKTMEELELAKKDAEEARHEAERANRVKSDFLANMSHEIRTPINSIMGFDEIILRESTDRDITQYASYIRRSGQTLLTLINDILDFSKIESGKMEIIPVDYDIKDLLTDMLLVVSPRAAEKGLALKSEIDEDLPRILHGDDVRIRQVVTNLLTNAVKYTDRGEVMLSVSVVEAGDIAKIKFSVKDTGIGIHDDDLEDMFKAFSRVEEKKHRNIEGTGLGLAICVLTLELMNSKLIVESEYGKGSDFYFVLEQEVVDASPVGKFNTDDGSDTRKVEITREDFTAPFARILVVDDVAMNLTVFKHLLKNSKMNIDTASSGAQSLEMMRSNDYDIVFMDHLMPEMDGIETLKKGVEEGIIDTGSLPVIALTANAISGSKEMFLSEGFTDYLSKPIEVKQLISLLQKYLPSDKIQKSR